MAPPGLKELADAYGVATEYWDWQGQHVEVRKRTLRGVLGAMGVQVEDPERAIADLALAPWRRMLAPVLVVPQGQAQTIDVHISHGSPVQVWVELEDGSPSLHLEQVQNDIEPREIDGRLVGEASFALPEQLPLGYHRVRAGSQEGQAEMRLVVTPVALTLPETLRRPAWGLATQLYSVRSGDSWGVGDLVDLEDLAIWSAAEHGADYLLVNPIHAVDPTAPMEPSPYLPTSRRFANPMYLRVERVPEYAQLEWRDRWEADRLGGRLRIEVDALDRIDRDAAWSAKRQALELVHQVPRSAGREIAYRAFVARAGRGLEDYARWCAIAETHGRDWHQWPDDLRSARSAEVERFAAEHETLVDFHCWVQWLMEEQLDEVQAAARRAGMAIGVMHDLAVGVSVTGADAWRQQHVYAEGVTVGAPPDAYNQAGQDWSQPPWRPDRLAEAAYEPFREVIAAAMAHAGGVRIDHVAGLFRLWWIPPGAPPSEGTYVRQDHKAMVGILTLEAHRAGAVVVGEDVGVVEPWTRDYLSARGVLGTSILWFERDYEGDGRPLHPERWRELCLASVTTHDLPPTAGYLSGEHVRLRDKLGLLTRPLPEELAESEEARHEWLAELRRCGVLDEGDDVDTEQVVDALHDFLRRTPARLLCVALTDAVGDRRTQNQPGTVDQYPNWRVPLSGPDGEPLRLEEVFTSDRAARLLSLFR